MHTHTHDTQHHPDDHPAYLVKIAAAIAELSRQREEASALPHRSNTEHAARAARLALICMRLSAWWGLLARETYRDPRVHSLHMRAVVIASLAERDNARFWRDAAGDWQARAEHRPTSDAAGALSNWHELGVTA